MSAGEEVYQESVKELAMDKEINWEYKRFTSLLSVE